MNEKLFGVENKTSLNIQSKKSDFSEIDQTECFACIKY